MSLHVQCRRHLCSTMGNIRAAGHGGAAVEGGGAWKRREIHLAFSPASGIPVDTAGSLTAPLIAVLTRTTHSWLHRGPLPIGYVRSPGHPDATCRFTLRLTELHLYPFHTYEPLRWGRHGGLHKRRAMCMSPHYEMSYSHGRRLPPSSVLRKLSEREAYNWSSGRCAAAGEWRQDSCEPGARTS